MGVIVHVEACTHLHRAMTKIREAGGSPSVALNPHTPAEMIENVLDLVDHVLVMTVNPGFGGQAYIPTMTDKIKKIRKWMVALKQPKRRLEHVLRLVLIASLQDLVFLHTMIWHKELRNSQHWHWRAKASRPMNLSK